jgi:hypothetical protein
MVSEIGIIPFFTFPMGAIGATPLDVSRTIPSNITDQR